MKKHAASHSFLVITRVLSHLDKGRRCECMLHATQKHAVDQLQSFTVIIIIIIIINIIIVIHM